MNKIVFVGIALLGLCIVTVGLITISGPGESVYRSGDIVSDERGLKAREDIVVRLKAVEGELSKVLAKQKLMGRLLNKNDNLAGKPLDSEMNKSETEAVVGAELLDNRESKEKLELENLNRIGERYDQALYSENYDDEWSDMAEASVSGALQDFITEKGLQVRELNCHKTFCKLIMYVSDNTLDYDSVNDNFLDNLPWETEMYSQAKRDEYGGMTITNFIARENYALPE